MREAEEAALGLFLALGDLFERAVAWVQSATRSIDVRVVPIAGPLVRPFLVAIFTLTLVELIRTHRKSTGVGRTSRTPSTKSPVVKMALWALLFYVFRSRFASASWIAGTGGELFFGLAIWILSFEIAFPAAADGPRSIVPGKQEIPAGDRSPGERWLWTFAAVAMAALGLWFCLTFAFDRAWAEAAFFWLLLAMASARLLARQKVALASWAEGLRARHPLPPRVADRPAIRRAHTMLGMAEKVLPPRLSREELGDALEKAIALAATEARSWRIDAIWIAAIGTCAVNTLRELPSLCFPRRPRGR